MGSITAKTSSVAQPKGKVMKALIIIVAMLASLQSAFAENCFKTSERISGPDKICIYRCPTGGEGTITVSLGTVCPSQLQR